MTTTRDDTLTKCKIGSLEFIPKDCGGGDAPRRIASHGAIGMDGEWTEDLGQGARRDTVSAELTEEEWLKLDRIMRAAEVIDIVHPLFGAYRGRVVSCPYRAGLLDHVDVTITLIEEGEHRQYSIMPSLGQASKAARDAFTSFSSACDSMSDMVDGFSDDIGSLWDAVEAFGEFLGDIENGIEKTWHEAGAAFDGISHAVNGVVGIVDAIISIPADAVSYAEDLIDSSYELIDSARQIVDAIGSEVADTWRSVSSVGDRLVDAVLNDYLGAVTDEALEILLGANPDMMDMFIVPGGHELRIPVLR